MRTAKLKSAYNLLIIGPRGSGALSLRWIQFASLFRCARSSWVIVLLGIGFTCCSTFAYRVIPKYSYFQYLLVSVYLRESDSSYFAKIGNTRLLYL